MFFILGILRMVGNVDIQKLIDFLQSSWGIFSLGTLSVLAFYAKVKNAELVKDILGMGKRKKKIKQLQRMLDSSLLTESEEDAVKYDLVKFDYEDLLNIKGETLPILRKLNSYENPQDAAFIFKECKSNLVFNIETNEFESKKNIDDKFTKIALIKLFVGLVIYVSSIGLSYFFVIKSSNTISNFIMSMLGFLGQLNRTTVSLIQLTSISLIMIITVFLALQILKLFVKDALLTRFMEKKLKESRS